MALSDCPKCWDTPCTCGYEYKDYTNDRLVDTIISILKYRSKEDAKAIIEQALTKLTNQTA